MDNNIKIIQVINAMITNSDKITNVIKKNKEFFFLYNNKYKWSISKNDSDIFFLHIYPGDEKSLDELAVFSEWDNYNFVTYKSDEFKAKEAHESFVELYLLVSEKVAGIDEMFRDILADF